MSSAAPSDFDARHALDLVADYRVAEDVGPRLAGVPVFGGLGLGLVFSAQSGRPYTVAAGPAPIDNSVFFAGGRFNGQRRPWTTQLDLRLDKQFRAGPSTITAFLWAENVLGSENVTALYRATGEPGDDGYLDTPGGGAYLNAVVDREGGAFNYLAYVGGPANIGGARSTDGSLFYGPPRRIRFGLRVAL